MSNVIQECYKANKQGAILRIIFTFISFYLFSKLNNKFVKKYFLLLLAFLLYVLDQVDYGWERLAGPKGEMCAKQFSYQLPDKIVDSMSYLMLFLFFDFNSTSFTILLLFFTFWRVIGVALFTWKKQGIYLITNFDLIKELMVYFYFFGNDYKYLPFLIGAKILFEILVFKGDFNK